MFIKYKLDRLIAFFCAAFTVGLLAGCASLPAGLNSERITATFGSYGVEILRAGKSRRVSNLYSTHGGQNVMRTYAVVDFVEPVAPALRDIHEDIVSGGSIGASFKDAGWTITKQPVFIGELEIPASYVEIGTLMAIDLPQTLAVHVYHFRVENEARRLAYARITEIHHPDYLNAAKLRQLFGEILFDDSNRDAVHDFIGPRECREMSRKSGFTRFIACKLFKSLICNELEVPSHDLAQTLFDLHRSGIVNDWRHRRCRR